MYLRTVVIALVLLAAGLFPAAAPATALAQDVCPNVGETGPGVERIEGQGFYTFYGMAIVVDQPVIALVDATYVVQGMENEFAPSAGQVIGQITSDFFSSPFSYTIDLPISPTALALDVDQDGEEEGGTQMFYADLGQNILNMQRLEEFTQSGLLTSLVIDGETQQILEGALLLFAPDDEQGFPCDAGEDGLLFTEDDLIAALPAGYTVAHIDGAAVTFDRSPVANLDVNEIAAAATPDFSDQGIVESYGSLIDFLRERYVFNNFYDFDWDALYAEFLPQVEQAEADNNVGEYFVALFGLAQEIRDAHVNVDPGQGQIFSDPQAAATFNQFLAFAHGDIGARAVELDDGRIIIGQIRSDGPAAEAGLAFGTEIVSVNGLPVAEALQTVRYPFFPSSDATVRYRQAEWLLNAEPNTEMEVGYILPDATDVMTTSFTAVKSPPSSPVHVNMPMEYKLVDNFGYVTWPSFRRTGIATHIYADFIKEMNQNHVPAIIIDLRGNGGGATLMEHAVLSYLYSADDPYTLAGTTKFYYSTATGEWVSKFDELTLSAPAGVTPYLGEVVYLVDSACGSACEFTGYGLQRTGRATIIAQYASVGAGGSTNGVKLPGGMQFNYTASTDVSDETGMPTFQYVGVQPDIQVPVTEETERLKLEGRDPVLEAALAYLHSQELSTLDLTAATFAEGKISTMVPANWPPHPSGFGYTSPDDAAGLIFSPYTHTAATEPDAVAAAISEEAEKIGEHESEAGTWSLYEVPFGTKVVTLAVITIDDAPYVGLLAADDEVMLAALTVNVLYPALDGFTVVGE
ncbi:MAG: PDZ domain-containing protein [Caldilineaceae bacterium]|nr:PDZ domain-containing protein [Caldilineaceae bacterium]